MSLSDPFSTTATTASKWRVVRKHPFPSVVSDAMTLIRTLCTATWAFTLFNDSKVAHAFAGL